MTIKQKKVYNWLLENPGYLKKSKNKVINDHLPYSIYDIITEKDFDIAFKQAKLDHKLGSKIIDGTKIVTNLVSINDIFPGIDKFENTANENKITNSKIIDKTDKNRTIPGTYYITGCSHSPWQNKPMYKATFNYIKKNIQPLQGIILAGDILDLNSLSSHDKGKIPIKGVTLDWEYQESNKFLDQFDELILTSSGTKDFIYGNHCDRYNRIIKDTEIAKFGKSLISPDKALRLEERGYSVYKNWKDDFIKLGKYLNVCHGEFINVHTAKKTIDTYRESTLYFHTHRFQIFIEGLMGGFNMGFGGDINAPIFNFATRAMKNSWCNSSCLVTIDDDGFYHVEPLMWINNKLVVGGKEY